MKIISKCFKCKRSTNNGNFILSYIHLPYIHLEKYKNQKVFNFIINSSKDDTEIGHWANLIIFNNKLLFILDGLDQIKNNVDIMNCIHSFAANNKLKSYQFNVRYQKKSSKKCGLLACYIVQKSTHISTASFINLRKLLLHNSIITNEKLMLSSMKKHFQLTF